MHYLIFKLIKLYKKKSTKLKDYKNYCKIKYLSLMLNMLNNTHKNTISKRLLCLSFGRL
ncbi:hypothetical protein HMPREF1860_01169 [Prevotella amnii]|uniref:Uncharacterized protein n=1 Tax=Prevotella amnii TaxID=419005 RepID=A0A134BDU6_9BACT|nr:hypothetical protein HMPREF1860_01169 [Prevotella amnii]